MNDIQNKDDIRVFVDAFYTKIQADELLGPIFHSKIKEDQWPVHLEKMYAFWNTVLFGKAEYKGNPFSKHATLPVSSGHFDHWVSMLSSVIDENFQGTKADEVKWRASKMAQMFKIKLKLLDDNQSYQPIM